MTPSPSLLGPDLRGRVLCDRFRLDAIVGCGGTANVYDALDLRLRRRVAVKVVHPEHARSEAQRLRVRQEAVLAGILDHPHVVPIHDLAEDAGTGGEPIVFMVMPLLRGPTLRDLVLAGPIDWPRALLLVRQLLDGLAAVHALGVIHRDLKSTNCIVCEVDGADHLRLLDLGLAKVLASGLFSRTPASAQGGVVGTLAYLSPEQARGLAVDVRSDLYSVGVLLFEVLTRRVPFVGSDYDVLTAHVAEEPPSPREFAPGVPARVEGVVLRALAKDPAERFPSAQAFDAALAEVLVDEGVAVGTPFRAPCPSRHAGSDEAQASLAAWTCFEYDRAHRTADAAARLNWAWSPLKLLMSLLPAEESGEINAHDDR